jgi:Transcriptional regulators
MNLENMFASLPKGNISDVIVERITQQLISGELQPGDKLPTELEFCEQLGVSRNVVREAIKILVALGVVEIRRAEGTFIVEEYTQRLLNPMIYGLILTERNMAELLEVNICVLSEVLQLAKERMTPEQKAHLDEIYGDIKCTVMNPVNDVDRMAELSTMFYTHLNSCCGNQLMYQVYNLLLQVFSEARRKAFCNIVVTGQRELHLRNYDMIMEYLNGDTIEVKDVRERVLGAWKDVLVKP